MSQYKTIVVKFFIFMALLFVTDRAVSYFILEGLYKYYGFDKPAEILMIGHSHTMLGIDEVLMETELQTTVAKYAREGANNLDRLLMLKHFLNTNGEGVKLVTYDVDANFLTSEGLSENSYRLFFPFLDDSPEIREYIKNESDSKLDYLSKLFIKTARYNDLNLKASFRGHLQNFTNIKYGVLDTVTLKQQVANGEFRKITFNEEAKKQFEETLNLLAEKNIPTFLILIPTNQIINDAEPEKYQQAIQLLRNYEKQYTNVHFFDYNVLFAKRHELFYDPIHLNPQGQKEVTEKLIEDIKIFTLNTSK